RGHPPENTDAPHSSTRNELQLIAVHNLRIPYFHGSKLGQQWIFSKSPTKLKSRTSSYHVVKASALNAEILSSARRTRLNVRTLKRKRIQEDMRLVASLEIHFTRLGLAWPHLKWIG